MSEHCMSIPFSGNFFVRVVQGTFDLTASIWFNAKIEYDIVDQERLDTMFGGILPAEFMQKDAGLAVKRTFTALFEEGASLDEIKHKTVNEADRALAHNRIEEWESRCGVRATRISDMQIQVDHKTEKLLASVDIGASVSEKPKVNSWKCTCGNLNSGKFCTECGAKKPDFWLCSCGNNNNGNFCTECGKPKNS